MTIMHHSNLCITPSHISDVNISIWSFCAATVRVYNKQTIAGGSDTGGTAWHPGGTDTGTHAGTDGTVTGDTQAAGHRRHGMWDTAGSAGCAVRLGTAQPAQ